MRRPATGEAAPPTAGGWTLIDQTDALVDDAEIATATSELKQEIGLPDSMDSEERGEIVEADEVINRGAALARDPRVQRSVLESLVAAQPVAAKPAFPTRRRCGARSRSSSASSARPPGAHYTTPQTPSRSASRPAISVPRAPPGGRGARVPVVACLVPGAVVRRPAPGPAAARPLPRPQNLPLWSATCARL